MGIWISDERALEIIEPGMGGNWERATESNGRVSGTIFREGNRLFLLRYIEVTPGTYIFDDDHLDYDAETEEIYCEEMEMYQLHPVKYRVKQEPEQDEE
jgi:hypothetical protein